MEYWPGTKIIKSTNNGFNWQGNPNLIMRDVEMRNINNAKIQGLGQKEKENITYITKHRKYGPKLLEKK